jgi:hypothetical protein
MHEHNTTNKMNREEEEIISQVQNLYATQADMNHFDASRGEEELDINDAIKQQQLTQTPGPCIREYESA